MTVFIPDMCLVRAAVVLCIGCLRAGGKGERNLIWFLTFVEYRDNAERVAAALSSVSTKFVWPPHIDLWSCGLLETKHGRNWPYKCKPFHSVRASWTCHSTVYACISQAVSVPPDFTLKPCSVTHICCMSCLSCSFVVTECKLRSSILCAACMNTSAVTFTWPMWILP